MCWCVFLSIRVYIYIVGILNFGERWVWVWVDENVLVMYVLMGDLVIFCFGLYK